MTLPTGFLSQISLDNKGHILKGVALGICGQLESEKREDFLWF